MDFNFDDILREFGVDTESQPEQEEEKAEAPDRDDTAEAVFSEAPEEPETEENDAFDPPEENAEED